jgi:hypothetical protein
VRCSRSLCGPPSLLCRSLGEHRALGPQHSGSGGPLVLTEGWDVDDGIICEQVLEVQQDVLQQEGVHLTKKFRERDVVVWFHEVVIEATN